MNWVRRTPYSVPHRVVAEFPRTRFKPFSVRTKCGQVLTGELYSVDVLDEEECALCSKGRVHPSARPLVRR